MEIPLIDVKMLFKNVNYLTSQFVVSSNEYKDFLRFAGGFINSQGDGKGYTIANQILIYGFNSRARLCYDESTWNNMGVTVIKPEEPIHIMEKAGTKEGYRDRIIYDISATNAAPLQENNSPEPGTMCELLMKAAPCKIEFNRKQASGMANYNYEQNIITVGKGFKGFEHIFMELSSVYGHYYMAKDDNSKHNENYERKIKSASSGKPVYKDTYLKYVDGRYYECSENDIVKSESGGKLFIISQDPGGSRYKIPVIKKQIQIPPGEIKIPQFTYKKATHREEAAGISYMVSTAAGLDTSIYSDFQNLKWRDMEYTDVRKSLEKIVNIGRTIKHNYDVKLNDLIIANSSSVSNYESEVV